MLEVGCFLFGAQVTLVEELEKAIIDSSGQFQGFLRAFDDPLMKPIRNAEGTKFVCQSLLFLD